MRNRKQGEKKMKQFTSDELRKTWKQFYIERGHVDVGAVSLVSDGSTGVLFNVAGMQPLMPYLWGRSILLEQGFAMYRGASVPMTLIP